MIDAAIAEFLKLRRHTATWLLVWIYPVGIAVILCSTMIRELVMHAGPETMSTAALWVERSRLIWSVPQSTLGRFVIAGFCAVAFSGEYGWNTWKLLIPVRARWQLLVAKWIVVTGLIFAAFVAADVLVLAGEGLRALPGLKPVPADLAAAAVVRGHLEGFVQAFLPVAYTVAWAGLLAIATRSVLGTMLLSIAIITVEQLLVAITAILAGYGAGATMAGMTLLPFYHVGNCIEWFRNGRSLVLFVGPADRLALDWGTSLMASVGWIGALGAMTLLLFSRQDQN